MYSLVPYPGCPRTFSDLVEIELFPPVGLWFDEQTGICFVTREMG